MAWISVIDVVNVTAIVWRWALKVTHENEEQPGVMNFLLQSMLISLECEFNVSYTEKWGLTSNKL